MDYGINILNNQLIVKSCINHRSSYFNYFVFVVWGKPIYYISHFLEEL